MPEPTIKLTQQQIDFFRNEGFRAIDQPLTTPDELVWLRQTYDPLFCDRVGWEEGMQFDLASAEEE